MQIIKRYLSKSFLDLFIRDFRNLVRIVNNSLGELDLSIREDYLNVYFKGNSLAKISRKEPISYKVKIHKKFFEGTGADNPEFFEEKKVSNNYVTLTLSLQKPPLRFLQKKHINQFCNRVKHVNYGEEIVFEQALITDNLEREDFIIIDRQVTDKVLGRKRLDLLALEQISPNENKYGFIVIEVKLGNNPELKKDVALQLDGYVNHIKRYIKDYQRCYQTQYIQKKVIGTFNPLSFGEISIVEQVKGLVVVSGYSKMASQSIIELKKNYPNIEVKRFEYKL